MKSTSALIMLSPVDGSQWQK